MFLTLSQHIGNILISQKKFNLEIWMSIGPNHHIVKYERCLVPSETAILKRFVNKMVHLSVGQL